MTNSNLSQAQLPHAHEGSVKLLPKPHGAPEFKCSPLPLLDLFTLFYFGLNRSVFTLSKQQLFTHVALTIALLTYAAIFRNFC